MVGVSLYFQSSGIIMVSPWERALPSRTKTSRQAKYKIVGTGSKNFATGSLGVKGSGAAFVSTP